MDLYMQRLYVKAVTPGRMTRKEKEQYIQLHQKYLNLDAKFLIEYLSVRNELLMFYDMESHALVVIIGIQLIRFENKILVYFVNVVIEEDYKHEGCISHTTVKYAIKMFLLHPFCEKYCCGLASSSGSLEYTIRHRPSWPDEQKRTPLSVNKIMIKALRQIGIEQYKIIASHVITCNLAPKIQGTFHTKTPKNRRLDTYFHRINPGAEQGEQVFFLNPFYLSHAIDLAIRALHASLIRRPKLYHKIRKTKEVKPYYTLWLMTRCFVSVKISALWPFSKIH